MIEYIRMIGDGLVWSVTLLLWVFVALYGVRTSWWKRVPGRALFSITLVSALMLTLGSLRVIIGTPDTVVVLRTLLYLTVAIVLLRLLGLFVRTQRTAHEHRSEDDQPPTTHTRTDTPDGA